MSAVCLATLDFYPIYTEVGLPILCRHLLYIVCKLHLFHINVDLPIIGPHLIFTQYATKVAAVASPVTQKNQS